MPKIVRIVATPLEFTMGPGRGYGTSRGMNLKRVSCLITLETSDGVLGVGDASGPPGAIREYLSIVAPFFVGQSLYDFEIVAGRILGKLYHFGAQSHLLSCLGGVNIAVFDAIGKTLRVPVHDLLGGRSSERLACYATTGYFTEDSTNDFERQLTVVKAQNFRGAKIKIGANPVSDLERVRAARRILGDSTLLMVDMNANYTVDVALQSLRQIEPYGIHWCEEPLPPNDVRGYAELRARSPVSIAAGEAHYGAQDFKRLVDSRAIDILQPSIVTGGGFGEARAVAVLAKLNNLRLSPPCWGSAVALAATVHFAASLPEWPHNAHAPYPMLVEYDVSENPLRDKLAKNPLRPEHGFIPIPSGDGLGIEIDPEVVETFRLS